LTDSFEKLEKIWKYFEIKLSIYNSSQKVNLLMRSGLILYYFIAGFLSIAAFSLPAKLADGFTAEQIEEDLHSSDLIWIVK